MLPRRQPHSRLSSHHKRSSGTFSLDKLPPLSLPTLEPSLSRLSPFPTSTLPPLLPAQIHSSESTFDRPISLVGHPLYDGGGSSSSHSSKVGTLPPVRIGKKSFTGSRRRSIPTGRINCICGNFTLRKDMVECVGCGELSHRGCYISNSLALILDFECLKCQASGHRSKDPMISGAGEVGLTGPSHLGGMRRGSFDGTDSSNGASDYEDHHPSSCSDEGSASSEVSDLGTVSPGTSALVEHPKFIEPDRKTFECREHFTAWAKGIYTAEYPFGSAELKNSVKSVTITCRNYRLPIRCPWTLKALADYARIDPAMEKRLPFRLSEEESYLVHTQECIDDVTSKMAYRYPHSRANHSAMSTQPAIATSTSIPLSPSFSAAAPSVHQNSQLFPGPSTNPDHHHGNATSPTRESRYLLNKLRLDAAEGLGMLSGSSTSKGDLQQPSFGRYSGWSSSSSSFLG